jgi:hypothetical protein
VVGFFIFWTKRLERANSGEGEWRNRVAARPQLSFSKEERDTERGWAADSRGRRAVRLVGPNSWLCHESPVGLVDPPEDREMLCVFAIQRQYTD